MGYIKSSGLFIILLFIFNTGCIDDKCGAIVCNNDGVCVDGSCSCLQGYEGEQCNDQWYEKFEGKWNTTETDKHGNILNKYQIEIVSSSFPDTFYLLNFAARVDTLKCYRGAFLKFIAPEKTLTDTTIVQGSETQISQDLSTLSGVYTTVKDDISTTVSFTSTR